MNKSVFTITIPRFLEHNPKARKSFPYFLISKTFFNDDKVSRCTPGMIALYVYLMNVCADHASGTIKVCVNSVPSNLKVGVRFAEVLVRLEELQLLTIEKNESFINRIEKNRIEKNINIAQSKIERDVSDFDFESIYKIYPNKRGKSRGLKLCQKIKSQGEFDDLKKAIENYSSDCIKNKRPPEFMKHFSTFMREWTDWINPEHQEKVKKWWEGLTEEELQKEMNRKIGDPR